MFVEIPKTPKTLSAEDIEILEKRLAELRHGINNHLALITAAVEIMRLKPDSTERMLENISKGPDRIQEELQTFTEDFDDHFDIKRT
ncbi:hypothetical protein N9B94_04640 [Verrucomicrobia bacterium]|nr:hypothetical protein [Verrucomicrobiota bacterium]